MAPADAGTLVHEAGMVIVGERHGTNEFPNLVLRVAMAAARHGHLIVALELGDDARDPTAAFARSDGSATDRKMLLATISWQRQDGRASQAMFSLVDGLRAQIQAGASIEIDVFDASPIGDPHAASYQIERERLLAERLLEIRTRAATLALSGNVHAELLPRPDAHHGFVPAAALVAEHTSLASLIGRHAGGASWCTLPVEGQFIAAAHPVRGRDQGDTAFLEVEPPCPIRTGVAYVGAITPSPPAVAP
jgi:hypothetical protein